MAIKKLNIKLINWHCFDSVEFALPEKSFLIKDSNGSGKTSLLSSLYSLFTNQPWPETKFKTSTKNLQSYFGIQSAENFWYVSGRYSPTGRFLTAFETPEELSFYSLKSIKNVKVLTYSPNDNLWFFSSRMEKLNKLDNLLSQIYGQQYIDILKNLKKLVSTKQKILKNKLIPGRTLDKVLIKTISISIAKHSQALWQFRIEFIKILNNNLIDFSSWIKTDLQDIKAKLNTHGVDGVENIYLLRDKDFLVKNWNKMEWISLTNKEVLLQRTMFGAHKDSFNITANGINIEKVLSRGEMRSLILFIKSIARRSLAKNYKVIWLLDDIFNELDEKRERKIFSNILKKTDWFIATGTKRTKLNIPTYSLKQLTKKN